MKILLVGNYSPDGQESMQRFAELLERELGELGYEAHLLRPPCKLNRKGAPAVGAAKWLGYIDKFLLFPSELKRAAKNVDLVHVCDHSNASYVRALTGKPHLVTCHDLLAIRSALGEIPQNATGRTGRILQKMILSGLNRAGNVACVSENSRRELKSVSTLSTSRIHVVYNGLNYPYSPMAEAEAEARVAALLGGSVPAFILHIGGNQWYKNREGVLEIYRQYLRGVADAKGAPKLVMAGKPLTESMRAFVEQHDLSEYVLTAEGCSNEDLRALYTRAEVLLFPSLAEGFGWPIIEAQACGCRVLTSDIAPMNEISSEAAVLGDPHDLAAMSAKLTEILHESAENRQRRVQAGLANAERFSTKKMIEEYLTLYQRISGQPMANH